ncbi:MAG: dephospho-CoA kinase [Bacteroidetes bacterium 4484_249]|nr:MAG: dephospho-CoA kinase [Bacteroidetes bacterium 4484_249]
MQNQKNSTGIKVGLTGNIGSGKSVVAEIFRILGVPVYHADLEAKKFLDNKNVQLEIKKRFGSAVFDNNLINRKKLAEIVFKNPEALSFLNSLIHPLVRQDLQLWIEKHSGFAYVVYEAAILFESGFYKNFDKIITVTSPLELSIKRVMKRDGIKREDVQIRIKNQWEQDKKIELSDFIINNDESQLILPQVLKINKKLTENQIS